MDPQLPRSFKSGTDSLRNLEERKWKRHDTDMIDEVVAQAPVFVSKIKDVNVHEGQPAHFDCRIEPIGDGSMQVKLSIYAGIINHFKIDNPKV